MRGYTTLLSHILGSNPEISGYAETARAYRSLIDLLKLRLVICHNGNFKPGCRYFLDMILHNDCHIGNAILKRRNISYLFMIRKPVPTIKSIVAMHRKRLEAGAKPGPLLLTVVDAAAHYRSRLNELSAFAHLLRGCNEKALVILAEDFIAEPQPVLDRLQSFLQLRTPLSERYSVFSRTGQPRYGDPSNFIKAGKIDRDRPLYDEIDVPAEVIENAEAEYHRCQSELHRLFEAVKRTNPANLRAL